MKHFAPLALAIVLLLSCSEDWAYQHVKANQGSGGGAQGGTRLTHGGNPDSSAGSGGSEPAAGDGPGPSSGGTLAAAGAAGAPSLPASAGAPAAAGAGGVSDQTASSAGDGGAGGAAPVLVFTRYTADNPNFRYSGRIDFSTAKSPRFAEGAVHILARFKGTALRVLLNDEFRYGTYRDYFEVVIDGSERHKLTPVLGKTAYDVTQTLSDAEHNVVISKRTEASIGLGRFLGLEIAGELLSAPTAELHRLEIVGDSISAGSGNEALDGSTQCSEDGWGQPYQNGDLAYGPVLARSLNADYHVTAVSGIGLVRNYSSMYDARPMPEVYNLLFVDSKTSPAWDTTLYVPEAIVVMLGTNDFSPGDNPPDNPRAAMDKSVYRDAYIAFVDKLHGYYPNAHVFGVSSPMLGDGWPNSTDTFASDLKAVLSDVEAHYAGDAVPLFHKFFVNKINGTGCGTHPSVAQHADMASQLAPFVKNVMGW